jgi:hypothetical protein
MNDCFSVLDDNVIWSYVHSTHPLLDDCELYYTIKYAYTYILQQTARYSTIQKRQGGVQIYVEGDNDGQQSSC